MVVNLERNLLLDTLLLELERVEDGTEGGNRFLAGEDELQKFIQTFTLVDGNFEPDEDFFYVTLEPNTRYRIDANPTTPSNLDLVLGLYDDPFITPTLAVDEFGQSVVDDDSGEGLGARLFIDTGPFRQTYLFQADTYINAVARAEANAASLPSDAAVLPLNTIIGGDGAEEITSGSTDDNIDAGGGDDTVFAGGGDDTIFAGPGDDSVFGESGADVIYLGTGEDTVSGGTGVDTIYTCDPDFDDDVILGGSGEDVFIVLDPDDPNCDGEEAPPPGDGGTDGVPFPFPEVFDALRYFPEMDMMGIDIVFEKDATGDGTWLAFDIPGYDPEPADFPEDVLMDPGMMPGMMPVPAGAITIGTASAEGGVRTLNTASAQGFFRDSPEYAFTIESLNSGGMEPGADVIGNSRETALVLDTPTRQQHVLNQPTDNDVFSVYLQAGQNLSFTVEGLGEETNLRLQVLDSSGSTLGTATASGGTGQATTSITAAEEGFYFASVRHPQQQAFYDPYELTLGPSGATPPLEGNRQPDAAPDEAAVALGRTVAIDVLGNDDDPDGGALSLLALDTAGTRGTVSIEGGAVRYDPAGAFGDLAPGQSTTDSFRYAIADGMDGAANAEVTVVVTNDATPPEPMEPPVAADDEAAAGPGGNIAIDVLGNDSDPEGGALAVVSLDTSGLTGEATLEDGAVSYVASGFGGLAPGESAEDSFSYTVEDADGLTATAEVTVTVTAPQIDRDCSAGTAGDDAFVAEPGGPRCFDGLAGRDSIEIPLAFRDPGTTIAPIEGGFRVRAGEGEGIEVLGIESLIFEDGTLETDFGEIAASVYRYYVGGLGRLPDYGGAAFWVNEIEAGRISLGGFAQAILDSPEFRERFDPDADNETFLQSVYQNVYGREFDEGGLAFWLEPLDNGVFDRWEMVQVFADAPEAQDIYANDTDDGVLLLA